MELDYLLNETIKIAKKAGRFIKEERKNFDFSKIEYKGQNDLVSYVDKHAEALLVDHLSRLLPESGFIAEEGTGEEKNINWVIDPLDGTTNFMHGLPPYSVSIGLMDKSEILLGVIYEITADECYYAHKNGKAYCNQKPIQVSGIRNFKDGLYITGYPYRDFSKMDSFFKIMHHFLAHSHGLRRFGSAAADLAYVASGKCEGFFEFFLHPWDVAAGSLIVQRAGGIVTDFKGRDNYIFGRELIAGTFVQPEMLNIINQYWYSSK
jgi:myo-inositol-1(or 4)-monophosphatase